MIAVANDLGSELVFESACVRVGIGVPDDVNAEHTVDVEHVAPLFVDRFVPLGLAHKSKVCRNR